MQRIKKFILSLFALFAEQAHQRLFDYLGRSGMVLAANDFNREERVAFEDILEGFDDGLVLSSNIAKYTTDQVMMERSGDVIWRPQPYVAQSHDGMDATLNFDETTQLAVPATIGYAKHSTAILTATELRDLLQEKRLGEAAKQKLASDINVSVNAVAALQGTLVVKRTTAAAGYDDVAQADAICNEQGVPGYNRYFALNTRDYNGMAANLAVATRSFGNAKSEKAYERGYVGPVASFETYKLDYAPRLAAAGGGGGLTIDTTDGVNDYTPVAKSTAATGEVSNVDNRRQTVTVSSTVGVAAGDCFTIAALNSVHHITKTDTGQLKTFRVISVTDGTHMVISPPMITNQVASEASAQYQNCGINTKAANSAIVFLNTTAAPINCFWQKDAMEIMPGRYAVPDGSGVSVMRGTTEQGLELTMTKWVDGKTFKILYRWDTRWGVTMLLPEHAGIELFGQA